MSTLQEKLTVITGAAGFIGSAVVRFLNEEGWDQLVLVDDIGTTDKWKNLLGKRYLEILAPYQLFDWLQGKEEQIGAFIHLGACSDTTQTDGSFVFENNYRYSVRLAQYALSWGMRFIYASSAATYGDGAQGFKDDHDTLEQLRPLNLYGFSKSSFDLWVKHNSALDRLVGLKYFNVFGPNENHKGHMASMVYKMVPLVEKEGVLRLFKSTDPQRFKDGDQCRDFIYVKDAARMTCSFLLNKSSGIFNIGSGQTTTWNQLALAVFKALGKSPHIEYIDMPEALKKQYQNYTCAEMQKYLTEIEPSVGCQFNIEEAVEDYVNNYLVVGRRW